MSQSPEYDAIVIGFGPVGATVAALLAQAGHRIAAIERHPEIFPHPRAVHGDDDLLRTLQALGLAEEMLATGGEVMEHMAFTGVANRPLLELPMPTARPQGWPADWWLHQPTLERLLRARAHALGVHLFAPATLQTLIKEGDTWKCMLDTQPITARFVLGCDGANSSVRELMGFGYRQLHPSQHWYVTDGYAPKNHDNNLIHKQICDPAQPLTFVPGACRHLRYEAMDCNPSTDYHSLMTSLLAQHGAMPARVQRYTFRAGIAREWQRDGVFLLGDAAHATPPFAGQGLCAGIRDAANLWWKLDAALRYPEASTWPETYQAERQPHAVAYIRRAWQIGALVQTRHPVLRHVRDAVLKLVHHLPLLRSIVVGKMVKKPLPGKSPLLRMRLTFPQTRMADGRLSDALLGNGWALVKMAGVPSPALPTGLPVGMPLNVVELNGETDPAGELARWMRKYRMQWVVVRPDRWGFGTRG